MPQVSKTQEQLILEQKIAKAKSLLKHLEAQVLSLRLRNKADRERDRRQDKLNKLDQSIDEDYEALIRTGDTYIPNPNGNKKTNGVQKSSPGDVIPNGVGNGIGVANQSGSSSSKTVPHPKSTPNVHIDSDSNSMKKRKIE